MNDLRATTPDGTVLYVFIDDGPPGAKTVVLSHALGCTLSMWEPQIAALAERYRVVRYDHRGHGRSNAPEGDYTLEALGRDALAVIDLVSPGAPVNFVGLSMGGMVGMWLAIHHADRIARLVLANTTPHIPLRDMFTQRMQTARSEGMAGIAAPTFERWLGATFKAARPARHEDLVAGMAAMQPQGYAGCCAVLRDADQREAVARIAAPTLVISGNEDPATPIAVAQQLAAAIPGARAVFIPQAAHLSNLENPAAFNAALLEHLAR